MSSSSVNNNDNSYENIEAKRQQNIEDNRRFLAALKINDIRDEIKEITGENNNQENINSNERRPVKKEMSVDIVRRSSRIRKNIGLSENLPPIEEKRKKKTDENGTHQVPKTKLKLPEHMLIRYQSTCKKVALYNNKATFDDDDNENSLI